MSGGPEGWIPRRVCGACGKDLEEFSTSWWFASELEPPSQNTIAQNKGRARHEYRRIRNLYYHYALAAKTNLKIPDATSKRRVIIERLYTGRGKRRDRGNLVGGCKPLLDALVSAGLLLDDRDQYVEDHYHQFRHPSWSGVVITIEEGI